ncbi:MAG: hypothetical protein IK151_09190 [Erysipelotrichaceae bacterium]|nr:hypothetical protein [Erysipelotrichaceae bacterium]
MNKKELNLNDNELENVNGGFSFRNLFTKKSVKVNYYCPKCRKKWSEDINIKVDKCPNPKCNNPDIEVIM